MRSIAIVGAGQAGLQLAHGLLAEGYDVTVVSDRTPEQIRSGRVMSTQIMFGPALGLERAAGLNAWDGKAPGITALQATVWEPPGTPALRFTGRFDDEAQSVDQRVKMADWLDLYEARGGRVEYGAADARRLAALAASHDLTLVAAGRGDLARLFPRDPARSPYDRPQRSLACIYLYGVGHPPEYPAPQARSHLTSEAGELFVIPALTTGGLCDIVFFEGLPGGPFDCWQDRPDPDGCLTRTLGLLRRYAPVEYELCRNAEPTDARCTLYGAVTPTVRHPVVEAAPGRHVLGMADTVVVNDPVTGQGSNNAARCAARYLRAIKERGDAPFDRPWMERTFETFWDHAQYATEFTNAMLQPPPDHVRRLLAAAAHCPAVAHRFVNGYADPADFRHWLTDPDAAASYLAEIRAP
ncbi:styrene monooxygenase/indole monooxygenase family protein [Streptomyces olivaceiscleroticus]|uniref:Alanine-phosphoribitol ligase n=1 Tax=Streptomyces olivaceiscleroticus TaxID=68245 RepID=A0ABN1AT08_9ACTN